jgi:hypothetical protein
VPTLDFGPSYSTENGETNYNGGTLESTLRQRRSNNQWYWIGWVNFSTYVWLINDCLINSLNKFPAASGKLLASIQPWTISALL